MSSKTTTLLAIALLLAGSILLTSKFLFVSAVGTTDGASDYQADEEDGVSFDVVGARIITCAACRLNSLPRVRSFIENEAKSYPALYVEYIHGKDPELHFLDKHRRVISTHDLAPMSPLQIVQLLNNNGLHTWTVAPQYEAPEFHETDYCIAFRQTGGCSPKGAREPQFDAPCLSFIEESRSGICECKNGKDNVELPCGHEADTCDSFCTPADALRSEEQASHSIPAVPEPEDEDI